jgi:hypothetical protein
VKHPHGVKVEHVVKATGSKDRPRPEARHRQMIALLLALLVTVPNPRITPGLVRPLSRATICTTLASGAATSGMSRRR